MKKVTKRPVSGYTFIKTEEVGGTSLLSNDGSKLGAKKRNVVIAISPKDTESEWVPGDFVELGEGAKGFGVEYGEDTVICMPNGFIILVEKK
jgi:hypothetical protein